MLFSTHHLFLMAALLFNAFIPVTGQEIEDVRTSYNCIFLKAREAKMSTSGGSKKDASKSKLAAVCRSRKKTTTKPLYPEPSANQSHGQSPDQKTAQSKDRKRITEDIKTASSDNEDVDGLLIGVTLWSFQEGRTREEKRVLGPKSRLIAKRVNIDQPIKKNEQMRLSIEVPSIEPVYVYVLDREIYKDGTSSRPYLIFPLTTMLGGKNRIRAGELLTFPSPDDPEDFLVVQQNKPELTGELLTIIVSPQKLQLPESENIALIEDASTFEVIEGIEKTWQNRVKRSDDEIGKLWTAAESIAVETREILKSGDRVPSTIFYALGAKGDSPVAIQFRISYLTED